MKRVRHLKVDAQASAMLSNDRQREIQNAFDRVTLTVRAGDELSTQYWSLVVKVIERK